MREERWTSSSIDQSAALTERQSNGDIRCLAVRSEHGDRSLPPFARAPPRTFTPEAKVVRGNKQPDESIGKQNTNSQALRM